MAETQQPQTLKEDKMGEAHTKFRTTYYNMKRRCDNKKCDYYYLYGGKGIRCEWDSYKSFRDDMYESYIEHCKKYGEDNTTIDRIDNNKNYCKENCRWATKLEQGRNTSRNHRFEWKGKMLTLKEIYEMEGANIAYKTFARRVYSKGMTIEDAIKIPFINQEHRYDRKGGKYILKEIYEMEKPKVCYGTFMSRIYQSKWSIEDAVNTPEMRGGFRSELLYSNNK